MKKNILTILFLLTCCATFGQKAKISPDSLYHKDNGEKIYLRSEVDRIAEYKPNGAELFSFIAQNILYPTDAKKQEIQGKVYASFIVEKNGEISDIIIIKSLIESCDNEVIRLFSILPNKWTPAFKGGQPVRSQYIFPIWFQITEAKSNTRN